MLTREIIFRNFNLKKKNLKIVKTLNSLIKQNNQIISSLSSNYKDSFKKEKIRKFKKFS